MKRKLQNKGHLKRYSLCEVQRHAAPNDAWVIVDGFVYNITDHVLNHPGWKCGCAVSELLTVINSLGKPFQAYHS